jgi:hypothetical protein
MSSSVDTVEPKTDLLVGRFAEPEAGFGVMRGEGEG